MAVIATHYKKVQDDPLDTDSRSGSHEPDRNGRNADLADGACATAEHHARHGYLRDPEPAAPVWVCTTT